MASNKKTKWLKNLEKKILKISEVVVHICSSGNFEVLAIPENSPKIASALEACGTSKYSPHHEVSWL